MQLAALHSMAHHRKLPYRRKNLADISYTDRVIAHFVLNFVAMATVVGRGKMQLTAFDGPSTELYQGQTFQRNDMWTTQEEVNTIVIQQVFQVTAGTVLVVADDTDVFLLLLY